VRKVPSCAASDIDGAPVSDLQEGDRMVDMVGSRYGSGKRLKKCRCMPPSGAKRFRMPTELRHPTLSSRERFLMDTITLLGGRAG